MSTKKNNATHSTVKQECTRNSNSNKKAGKRTKAISILEYLISVWQGMNILDEKMSHNQYIYGME